MLKNNKLPIFFTAFVLLLACLITYGDTLTHDFMMDDRIYATPRAPVYTNYHNLGDFFNKPVDHHYAPFNFLLNASLFRLFMFKNPFPLYLINLLLFYINCGLLFVFIYLISESFITAALTSLLFCIHPMTGEMLQHITFNIIFVQTILMESGLIALFLYSKNNNIFYYIFSLLMVLIGLFCQETIILFPLFAAALLLFLTDLRFKRIFKLIIPFVLLIGLLIVIWFNVVSAHLSLGNLKTFQPWLFWSSCANFARIFFWYLSNLFIPINVVFMANMHPLKDYIWLWDLIFFSLGAGIVSLMIFYFKKSLESFALVFFLIGFILVFPCSLVRLQGSGAWEFEPYWLYFSSIGFYLFIILIILKLRKFISKTLFITLLLVLFISDFIATYSINIASRTEITYAENWLRKFPDNSMASFMVTSFYMHNENLKIPSDLIPDIINQLDDCIKKDIPQTFQLIERILSSKISFAQREGLFFKLASYYCKSGHTDKCEEMLHNIIGDKKDPGTYMQLSNTLYRSGDPKTAIILLKQCIALYPKYKEPYLFIGVILGNDRHYDESIYWWTRGLGLDPTDLRFVSNIAVAKNLIKIAPKTSKDDLDIAK